MRSAIFKILAALLVVAVVMLSIVLLMWDEPFMYLEALIGENLFLSSIVLVVVMVAATVFAPLTAMPLIPASAAMMGPFLVGCLSVIGWTIGSVIAFLIARYAGRPLLLKFTSLERLAEHEKKIPTDAQFVTIVLLRMVIPADVLSYALGLTSTVSLKTYTLATAVGVAWFSFAFAYMGDALYTRNVQVLVLFGVISLAVFVGGWYWLMRAKKKND